MSFTSEQEKEIRKILRTELLEILEAAQDEGSGVLDIFSTGLAPKDRLTAITNVVKNRMEQDS